MASRQREINPRPINLNACFPRRLFFPLSLVIFEVLALCHEIFMCQIYTKSINFAILLALLCHTAKLNILTYIPFLVAKRCVDINKCAAFKNCDVSSQKRLQRLLPVPV